MKTRTGALLVGAALMGSAWTAAPQVVPEGDDHTQVLTNPDLYYLDHADVSPPLRDMRVIPPSERAREGSRTNTVPLLPPGEAPKGWVDPLEELARRAAPATEVGTVAGLNFEGVQGGALPPDANGAVGATQYVEWVNFSFAVYNKASGALVYGPAAGNTLWAGFGGACESYNSGDPIVAYDKAAGRWVMTQFAFASSTGGPWYQCVAVSTTSDATGAWRRFAYNFAALNDYPKLGVWSDGYYVTFNMFSWSGAWSFQGARTCALDRVNMITPSNTPGPIQCFQNSGWAGLLPADLDGTTAPPAGAPNYQLSLGGSPTLRLYKFKVNWATPSLSTFSGPTSISVAAYTQPALTPIPQPGTTQLLDSLGDRVMHRLAYRNFGGYENLVVNHSVVTGGAAAGVRWYEIRNPNGTPSVYQQGTFSPDSTSRWMGSTAMDKAGNLLVGYSASSSSVYPAIRYTGRLAADALGTLQAENTLVAGTRSQTGTYGNRWGDYSAMTVDPADDCTFWFVSEYLRTGTSTGSTRIGSFRFPGCGSGYAVSACQWSAAIKESNGTAYTCPTNKVMVGRQHSGDENGNTWYYCCNVGNPTLATTANPAWSADIKESSGITYTCPTNKVLNGRQHSGDENGNTRYLCSNLLQGSVTVPVNAGTCAWSAAIKESTGTAYICPGNKVMVGRQHSGDENGNTWYYCCNLQ